MDIIRVILTVIYCLLCIGLAGIVLLQEGKVQGLSGAISGVADTYWGKNKGRSMEGTLNKATTFMAIGFIVLSFVLNIKW